MALLVAQTIEPPLPGFVALSDFNVYTLWKIAATYRLEMMRQGKTILFTGGK
jgi:hypothetical protein